MSRAFGVAALLVAAAAAQGTTIGFEEEFALAANRTQALAKLIPGTEDYYFYSCLNHQHEGEFDRVPGLVRAWIERHGRTARVVEIERRQALLTFAEDPAATFDYVRSQLGLRFDHQRRVPGEKPDLPTRLDPALISPAVLTARALRQHRNTLDGFRDSALEALAATELDDQLLASLLQRLQRPDVPNLPALIVRNLRNPRSGGFGTLAIHRALLLDQLEACVRSMPALLNENAFVETYLPRLAPSEDRDWRADPAVREAYLDRLQAFVQRLSPAHNSLIAHVLYHRLAHDLALGKPDKQRFVAYLALPRTGPWVDPRRVRRGEPLVDTSREFPTELGPIGNDEPLVRSYLEHYFRGEDSFESYAQHVHRDYLRRLFAETKILAGTGDMEQWYSLLDDPGYYARLEQRVDIEFPPTQRTTFSADEPVTVDVDLKNVPTLLVKVFEINTLNYHRETGKEIDASIDLDGLVANEETTHRYQEPPLRRVRQRFEFPALARPGVFVLDFIGNGKSSRVIVRKGALHLTERLGSAGHVLRVVDERGSHLPDASVWFGGREYGADERGEIAIPYSTAPATKSLVLSQGGRSSLVRWAHRAERYELRAGVHVDRESLLTGTTAELVVRPTLLLNGVHVGLDLLDEPVLTITATDLDGIESSQEVRDVALGAGAELTHRFRVPDRLRALVVGLRGKVRSLSRGEDVDLAAPTSSFELNAIAASGAVSCPLLGRGASGYVLDVLGRNGEPDADRAVELTLELEHYTDPVHVTLKTDERGRIELGMLPGVRKVGAKLPLCGIEFPLEGARRSWSAVVHAVAGEPIRVPFVGGRGGTPQSEVSLLEVRRGAFVRDAIAHVAIGGGFVELRGLAAGDYHLWLKAVERLMVVRVTAGELRDGLAVGADRWLEPTAESLHVVGLGLDGGDVVVRLANAGADTRVHAVASRYLPAYDPFARLVAPPRLAADAGGLARPETSYHAGREIGDEYRYILERRFATKFPGNMLPRPGLLLNPWALDEWSEAIGLGGGAGGKYGGRRGGRARGGAGPATGRPQDFAPGTGRELASLDFLPGPSRLLANLRPDRDGTVRIPRGDLGDGQLVQVVAVDRDDTVFATLPLAEGRLEPRDLRLARALDPERHFAEQRRVEFVRAGESVVLQEAGGPGAEVYDSLGSVFRLLRTLSGNADLDRFAFVLEWPQLDSARKAELYSRHACHELSFFLHEKDPEFFVAVVRPYLESKRDRTFLDEWLLGGDLGRYLEPWAFGRLNIVERILLARRIGGQREPVRRHVRELNDLIPPNVAVAERLFESAYRSRGLVAGGRYKADGGPAGPSTPGPGGPADRAPRAAAKAPAAEVRAAEPAEDVEQAEAEELGAELRDKDDALDEKGREEQDQARRKAVRRLYRAPERTRAYVEHNYWHRPIAEQGSGMIEVNAFWRDYAAAVDGGAPFVSPHVGEAHRSFAEVMLALAVLDLPFTAAEHEVARSDGRVTLRAKGPLLVVRKALAEVARREDGGGILVSQNLFRLDDRYRFEGNERLDKFVRDEFLVGVPYGCQVVVTNPTSAPRDLDLLLQVPQGALPLLSAAMTRGHRVRLEPYATQSIEYAFYFPTVGDFPHYPVHVTGGDDLVAFASPMPLHVVRELTKIDTTSWEHVSQNGSMDDVLAYLDGANLQRVELPAIAWRMRDRAAFDAVLGRLRQRHRYEPTLWSYGLLHRDESATREFLRHQEPFVRSCGPLLRSALVTTDPVERRWYQHVEFEPLINQRAHRFGRERQIPDLSVGAQYLALLGVLTHVPRLDADDWLGVTYYLLLQDRIEEAFASFARVDGERITARLQYDYLRAYLDFYTDDRAAARAIAERHVDHPVERWRERFREVVAQLDQAAGRAPAVADPLRAADDQGALAETAPALDLAVEARRVTLRYRNLERCRVNLYAMDVEFLFSAHPFVQQGSGSVAFIRPARSDAVELPADRSEVSFELPAEFHNANILVEAEAAGITQRQTYFASSLAVQVVESYGQLAVTNADTDRPLPKVYVKVFAREPGGNVRFHKDGYTDLRGRFDYASITTRSLAAAERYAILVLSEDHGAAVREVAPPAQ